MTSERYTIGREMLQRVDGKGGDAVVNSRRVKCRADAGRDYGSDHADGGLCRIPGSPEWPVCRQRSLRGALR